MTIQEKEKSKQKICRKTAAWQLITAIRELFWAEMVSGIGQYLSQKVILKCGHLALEVILMLLSRNLSFKIYRIFTHIFFSKLAHFYLEHGYLSVGKAHIHIKSLPIKRSEHSYTTVWRELQICKEYFPLLIWEEQLIKRICCTGIKTLTHFLLVKLLHFLCNKTGPILTKLKLCKSHDL